jgi:hypothetical protein
MDEIIQPVRRSDAVELGGPHEGMDGFGATMTNMCVSVVMVLLRLLLLQGTLIIAFGVCKSTGQRARAAMLV